MKRGSARAFARTNAEPAVCGVTLQRSDREDTRESDALGGARGGQRKRTPTDRRDGTDRYTQQYEKTCGIYNFRQTYRMPESKETAKTYPRGRPISDIEIHSLETKRREMATSLRSGRVIA